MPYVYLDDHIDEHDKVIAAGDAAFGLWVRCLAYCRRKLTGGRVPKSWGGVKGERSKTRRLVEVGLLEDAGDAFMVHDYERWNHSEEKTRKAREAAKARWQKDASANANAYANGDADAMQTQSERNAPAMPYAGARTRAAPNPQPLPSNQSSSSGTVVAPTLDDDELLAQTWRVLAVRRLSKREAEKGSVGSREKWLVSVAAGMPETYGGEANALLAAEGGWTAELLADALDPPPREPKPKAPDPTDSTAAAAAELRRRQQLPPCETCDSARQVESDDGTWRPCPDCSGAAA